MSSANTAKFFDTKVLGHPSGLFVLFFTEMWERFSFYGMRVLLLLYLTASVVGVNPGLGWTVESASALYGTYVMLLYITPVFGGIIADKFLGSWNSVIVGSIIMTAGHALMAIESNITFFLGLACLILGTGFFKPNMPSILGEMYKEFPAKKDGGYTIFYMGVNAGAFFGMLLCGYFAEKFGWHWGFGLAGIFMLLGTIQFWLSKPLFGNVGDIKKIDPSNKATEEVYNHPDEAKRNPFKISDLILIGIVSVLGLMFAFNDPISKNLPELDLFKFMDFQYGDGNVFRGQFIVIITTLLVFIYLIVSRILRYGKVVRDRMFSVIILAIAMLFFFMCFEQGASSLVIFARDNTQRILEGNAALMFNIVNTLFTLIPLTFISVVLIILAKRTFKIIPWSNIFLGICFIFIWGAALLMLKYDWSTKAYEVNYSAFEVPVMNKKTNTQEVDKNGKLVFNYIPVGEGDILNSDFNIVEQTATIGSRDMYQINDGLFLHPEAGGKLAIVDAEAKKELDAKYADQQEISNVTQAKIKAEIKGQVEIPTTWFSTINALFIISLASLISKIWDSRYNPPAAFKYGFGLIFVAIGFFVLGMGTMGIDATVKLSLFWLVAIYFFHTIGELFISPVGLSYVSKLVPGRMMAFMYGMWYLAIAIAQKLAAAIGGQVKTVQEDHSLSYFFFLFTGISVGAAILIMLLHPVIKKLMHGVK